MAGILMTISGAGINALTFVRTNYAFSENGGGEVEAERKRQYLAAEKFQKVKDKCNGDRMK